MYKRKGSTNGYYALRFKVLERDKFTCQYCGQAAPNVKLEVDHIIAVMDGGMDSEGNLVTSCYACNRGKEGLRVIVKRTRSYKEGQPISPQSSTQDRLVNALQAALKPMRPVELATLIGISQAHARNILRRLKIRGHVVVQGRGYIYTGEIP